MTLPPNPPADELDSILEYIHVQFRKPIPSDIREEVVTVGDLIVLEESKAAIRHLFATELRQMLGEMPKKYERQPNPEESPHIARLNTIKDQKNLIIDQATAVITRKLEEYES